MKSKQTLYTLAGILFIAGILSLFASGSPDGLEHTAENLNFASAAPSWWHGLIPDYAVPGLGSSPLASSLADILGALLVYGLFAGAARLIARTTAVRPPENKS